MDIIVGKKHNLDKFYTDPSIIQNLINHLSLDTYDLIIEPSAGNGAFLSYLPIEKTIALDIEPEIDNNQQIIIFKQDWFNYQISNHYDNILLVGNPPFGERNNLSRQFIIHALQFKNVQTIAFILPNVSKKHTNQKIFPENWRLAKIIDLPDNSFLLNNEPYHVPCSFFIWTVLPGIVDLRFNEKLYQSHPDFHFSTKDDFDFFVMGASPSVIKLPQEITKNNRGYYIKAYIEPSILKKNIQSISWSKLGNSSANGGVSWFSKPEFIQVYDAYKPI